MTARGAKAKGENVYLWKNADNSYEYIPLLGGKGGTSVTAPGGTWQYAAGKVGEDGLKVAKRATGGGGAGGASRKNSSAVTSSGRGGNGTSYSGGTGGGSSDVWAEGTYSGYAGSDIGGPGGSGMRNGSGNPSNGTGGLLIIKAKKIKNAGTLTARGVVAGAIYDAVTSTAGSSGGGSINVFYEECENLDKSKISAKGGEKVAGVTPAGGAGGEGTVTIGNISTGTFVENK